MKFILALFFTLLTPSFSQAADPITSTILTTLAIKQVKDTTDKITAAVDRATLNTDYMLEKNLRTLQLISNSLMTKLQDELGQNREYISTELAETTTRLSELVDQAKGGLLEIEDFASLDAQRLINQLPLKSDIFLVKRVDGYGVQYKVKGSYDFQLIGNAFEPGNQYTVTISNQRLDPGMIFGGAAANILRFSAPVTTLNGDFKKDSIKRIPLKVEVTKPGKDKPHYVFVSDILLLPTHPVQLILRETKKSFVWNNEDNSKICSRTVGPSGANGVWTQGEMTCSVDDLKNQKFTRQVSANTSGSHSRVDNVTFSGDKTTVQGICHNQCHDCPRTCTWVLGVQSRSAISETLPVGFEVLSINGLQPYTDQTATFLAYGSYEAKLSKDTETFTLVAEYFNGRQVTLYPQKLSEYGLRIAVDADNKADSNFKRLILEISPKQIEI
ncbi:hypothetical protein HC024_14740 [Methylococcaceae bacterium WWC4]|nr:hypothetical protein [Methylococcaceae bacterium WWC4]